MYANILSVNNNNHKCYLSLIWNMYANILLIIIIISVNLKHVCKHTVNNNNNHKCYLSLIWNMYANILLIIIIISVI